MINQEDNCRIRIVYLVLLVLDCPVFPVCLSRVSFQISFKMAISSFEKIIKYIGGWNIEQMLRDYGYHPLNTQRCGASEVIPDPVLF